MLELLYYLNRRADRWKFRNARQCISPAWTKHNGSPMVHTFTTRQHAHSAVPVTHTGISREYMYARCMLHRGSRAIGCTLHATVEQGLALWCMLQGLALCMLTVEQGLALWCYMTVLSLCVEQGLAPWCYIIHDDHSTGHTIDQSVFRPAVHFHCDVCQHGVYSSVYSMYSS